MGGGGEQEEREDDEGREKNRRDEEYGREEYEVKRWEEEEKGTMRGGIEGERVKRRWGGR